ncbi:cytochrome P450 [Russula compacta]|nr:cytochrome P450 [Russula compacta]
MVMSALSAPSPFFGLYEATRSSLLQLQLMVPDLGILSIAVILGLILLYAAHHSTGPYRKLPPGPRGYPIIGNLLQLRTANWIKFAEWRNKYGDLIYLNAAGKPIVVLNSQRAAVDLLDRRSAIYSDRPRSIVACDIMTGGLVLALARYGDAWRRMRRAANEGFNKSAVKAYHETQTKEAILMACDCLVKPAQWDWHFRRAAASMILSVVYGYPTVRSEQDHTVEYINDLSDRLTSAGSLGAHLVDFFSWMQYIPSSLARWKRNAEAWYKHDSAMLEGLLQTVEANIANGDDHQSVGAKLICEVERNKLSVRERSWFAGSMYIGGADTTSAMMGWWTLAMLTYPETQARAHAELDAVVGRSRLPTFSDCPHLPYIRAMVKEILRWRPVAPLAVPHLCAEDDWYEGMFIPKGTICIPNVWHMNRDPEIYGENAAHFDPARYLVDSGNMASVLQDTKDEGHFSYGFGRRLCVGRHVANDSLFIDIAVMLWATKIERKKDASGMMLPLDVDGYVDCGIVVRPVPFECEITPRFPEALSLLSQERELREL